MNDPFDGTWTNLQCTSTDPEELAEKVRGARLEITRPAAERYRHRVQLYLKDSFSQEPIEWYGETIPGKLRGQFLLDGTRYYCEIALRTPPPDTKQLCNCIFGTFSKIRSSAENSGSGGDLGDPGAWKAEESGPWKS